MMNGSSSSGLGLEKNVCPVKSFYGNVSSAKSSSPFLKTSGTLLPKNACLPPSLSEQVTTLLPQSTKRMRIESVQLKAGLNSRDRKLKTVERKRSSSVKISQGLHGKLNTTQKELIFKKPKNEVASFEEHHANGESRLHTPNENKGQESGGVKRFFKTRSLHHRRCVLTVPGRFVNLADLSNRAIGHPKSTKRDILNTGKNDKQCVSAAFEEKLIPSTADISSKTSDAIKSGCFTVEEGVKCKDVFEAAPEAEQKLTAGFANEVCEIENNNSIHKTHNSLESCTAVEHEKTEFPTSLATSKSDSCQTLLLTPRSWPRSQTVADISGNSPPICLPGLGNKCKSPGTASMFSSKKDKKVQMILDFGQKLHGTANCNTCGMTYARNHPDDELLHSQHHKDMFRTLQFNNRSNVRVVQDFQDGGFVVLVTAEDRRLVKRVADIKQIVDKELGYIIETSESALAKTFLYVLNTQVCGFCLAYPISLAYRMQNFGDPSKTQCCSEEAVAVRCAISRIWVLASHRRKGVASRLLDVVRGHFLMGYPLSTDEIAFSDPTPDGAKFAAKYCQTDHFLVYNKNSM